MQRKAEKKEVQRSGMASNNMPAPMVELSDGLMEQMVGLVRDVNKIKKGIWVLVVEMRWLVGVVERWMERDEKVMVSGDTHFLQHFHCLFLLPLYYLLFHLPILFLNDYLE